MNLNDPQIRHMVDASMKALDSPGGDEILQRMIDGQMSIEDGLVALLMLSGEYERLNHREPSEGC
jgi:hypothetical protein